MSEQTPNSHSQSSQDKELQLNNILNLLLEDRVPKAESTTLINSLFELMLWAERKSPELIINTLEMGILEQLISVQHEGFDRVVSLIKGATLLFGNCVQDGLISSFLLSCKYGDQVLKATVAALAQKPKFDREELIEYVGSFLKAYAKHFNEKTAEFYIKDNQCMLVQVCCNFYNCPEQLTRTSVTNILLSLLSSPMTQKFVYGSSKEHVNDSFYMKWAQVLTVKFRGQLIDFNSQIRDCNKFEIQRRLQELNDAIILWEDMTAISQAEFLFRKSFLTELLQPLLVGSMCKKSRPIFSLKFTLILLRKLLPVLKNLNLLQDLGRMLFLEEEFQLPYSKLQKLDISRPFDISRITSKSEIRLSAEQINEFHDSDPQNSICNAAGINEFFLVMLRSKDSQFLSQGCRFLESLINTVRKHHSNKQVLQFYVKNLHFGHRTTCKMYNQITETLISQLNATHSISTLRTICRCILTLQKRNHIDSKDKAGKIHRLEDDNKNRLIFLLRSTIKDAQSLIWERQNLDYVSEVFQYDLKAIESMDLDKDPHEGRLEEMNNEIQIFSQNFAQQVNQKSEEVDLPFYECLPDTPGDTSRYKLVKFLLIRRLRYCLIESGLEELRSSSLDKKEQNQECDSLIRNYQRNVILSEGRIYKPSEILSLSSIKHPFHPCCLVDNKNEINVALIDDEVALIIGYIDESKQTIKIMMNIKIKHVMAEVKARGNKMLLEILVRTYDYKTQRLMKKSSFCLRKFEMGRQYIPNKRDKFREKQLAFILRLIKKCEADIPEISLI